MNPWVQLGATLLVGMLTAGGALLGVLLNARVGNRATEQREVQARREEWSKRFYEALAYAVDDTSARKRAAGLHLMVALLDSKLASADEIRLMELFADRALKPLFQEGTDQPDIGLPDDDDSPDEDGEMLA